jgi:hypothetical protein
MKSIPQFTSHSLSTCINRTGTHIPELRKYVYYKLTGNWIKSFKNHKQVLRYYQHVYKRNFCFKLRTNYTYKIMEMF